MLQASKKFGSLTSSRRHSLKYSLVSGHQARISDKLQFSSECGGRLISRTAGAGYMTAVVS
jgi:hypothetical protein